MSSEPPEKKRRVSDSGEDKTNDEDKLAADDASAGGAEEEDWTYDRLWDDKDISGNWDKRNVKFWKTQKADIRGATGGGVSKRDLAYSKDFMHKLRQRVLNSDADEARFKKALDLGAGIGRVSNAILKDYCSHVDLVEFVDKHLKKAKETLEGTTGCTFDFHHKSVQEFQPEPATYDLVWSQWILMYLMDADAIALLKKLGPSLTKGGVIVMKENMIHTDEMTYFDRADGELWEPGNGTGPVSVVRTQMHYEDLIERANLTIRSSEVQQDPSKKTMPMIIFE
eukprot:CAMPEP_0206526718 /NCGR_PEP_ID=MMETSP0325_2-20121206/914_1 /ASSEMBLY_ACC=CAM_ASM_000347 /TAXON_ID=2866 /ORGANISM="Crypthecodinium cohnii, Strain Seligo" /LENGTH=281 /DNA_ID=CAMNT_0054021979 /DNA_START=41 /DNA_END=884 /DNA_ORIENTATION=+